MMCKLALRNVKRMAKDYVVYFMTMAVVTALMFSFNTLLFSKDVQNLFQMDAMMSVMTGLATAFIVPIIAWLINYMVRFVLEKRSREFGIYLLVGVKKKEIARLYFTENLLLGAGAFLVGMGLGLLFQQILLSIFYSMVQLDYKLHLEWNRNCILMTAACYLGCYLLALFRSRKKFRKMNIHDLMESQRQNEEIKETHEKAKRWFLPLSVLFLVVFGVFLFCFKAWDTGVVIAFLIGLVLTIYLFYTGIAAWIACYVRKKGAAIYRGDALFLLRQFSSKIRTLRFTMGTLTALFTLAILGSSVAFMFNHFQNEVLVSKFPFDVQVYSSNVKDEFQQEIALLKQETAIKEIFTYKVYENETNQVNAYLYTHLKEFGSEYRNADGTPDWKKISKNEELAYCNYDTYMGLSDYNRLRTMIGLSEVQLKEDQYAIHIKDRVLNQTGDFSSRIKIQGTDGTLSFAGYHTEGFSQNGHNGGDYIIIVPDAVLAQMHPYYAELVADIKGEAPADLEKRLDDLEKDPDKISVQGHTMTEAASDDWDGEALGNSCSGSDTIVTYTAKNLVRDNLIPEVKYMLSSLMFPLFYIGLVFLCVALTVLSVQQLSDSVKYKFRYRVLFQIGYSRREIRRMILKQLAGYYLCPACVSLAISGLVCVYVGGKFDFYTGVRAAPATYFLISSVLFFGIYLVYFIITYIGFCRNVEEWG